jgi:hypothetical protein
VNRLAGLFEPAADREIASAQAGTGISTGAHGRRSGRNPSGTKSERFLRTADAAKRKYLRSRRDGGKWRRGELNHLWEKSTNLRYDKHLRREVRFGLIKAQVQTCSSFLMRGHRFWNRSKPRGGVQTGNLHFQGRVDFEGGRQRVRQGRGHS